MKLQTRKQKVTNVLIGVLIVCFFSTIACVCVCMKEAIVFDAYSDVILPEKMLVSIVYTDEKTTETRTEHCPITMDELEYYASLVAGKSVGESAGCQQSVANVLYNDIVEEGGNADLAFKIYQWVEIETPTSDTYEAVDAVFNRGEFLLDDDVLWINEKDQYSAFHSKLEEVCTIGNIVFYRNEKN